MESVFHIYQLIQFGIEQIWSHMPQCRDQKRHSSGIVRERSFMERHFFWLLLDSEHKGIPFLSESCYQISVRKCHRGIPASTMLWTFSNRLRMQSLKAARNKGKIPCHKKNIVYCSIGLSGDICCLLRKLSERKTSWQPSHIQKSCIFWGKVMKGIDRLSKWNC